MLFNAVNGQVFPSSMHCGVSYGHVHTAMRSSRASDVATTREWTRFLSTLANLPQLREFAARSRRNDSHGSLCRP